MAAEFAGFHHREVHGVPVLWRPDERFKTLRVVAVAQRPLDGRAAARALLPSLMLHGTASDPDRPALARRMERLFGAAVGPSVSRQGETEVLRTSLDAVAGSFLPGDPDQLGDGLAFLADLLLRPRLEGEGFPAGVFERERRQAVAAARAVFDDKGAWAMEQARRLAFEGEPMAIPDHGGVEALEALEREEPERARRDLLVHGRLVVVAGGALPEELPPHLEPLLGAWPARAPEPIPRPVRVAAREPRRAVEHTDLRQARQVLVFRFPRPDDPVARAAVVLCANLLGGGPHARLFREVREKRSWVYGIHAGAETHKGALTVQAGLDAEHAGAVEEEVLRQLAALARGDFEDQELATARQTLLGPFAAVHDSLAWRLHYTADQWLLGEDTTPEQKMAVYREVPRDAVVAAAASVWHDFSYLLAPAGQEEKRTA